MFVQFSDATNTTIINVFAEAQNPEHWPDLGEVEANDSRYLAFVQSQTFSAEDLIATQKDSLLREAALRIAPLQDAVDLDEASAEETLRLKAWKQYRVAVNRVNLQAGFPDVVSWPESPGN